MNDSSTSLTLPDEFVLLLHKPNGSYYLSCNYTVAAQIGELVLQERVQLENNRKLRLLDSSHTGSAGLDTLVSRIAKKAGTKDKPVSLATLTVSQEAARKEHRALLVEHEILVHQSERFLGIFPVSRYRPDDKRRDQLIRELGGVARSTKTPDERLALRAALVHASGLARVLGFDKTERAKLKEISKGQELNEAVAAAIAGSNAAMSASITGTAGAMMGMGGD